MAFDRWWKFSEDMATTERDEPGVYELRDVRAMIIYIGSSNEVRRKLLGHLAEPASTCIRKNAENYRVEYTPACRDRERELYDEFVRIIGSPPKCNAARQS